MQSSYQYHFGGQAAAAKGAATSSPTKSPAKAQPAATSSFNAKVDWGASSGAAAQSNSSGSVPFGFGGNNSSVSFGGAGATASAQGSRSNAPKPGFGGPSATQAAKPGFGGQSQIGAAASFGGPSSSAVSRPAASFGGASAAAGSNQAASSIGFGFSSAQSWAVQESNKHQTNCTSVKEYAYGEDRNQRFRPQMEDTHSIVDGVVASDPSSGLFAIFDGHGGRQVSDYCAERVPIELRKELMKNPTDLHQPLLDVFSKVSNELRLIDSDGCGSTACVTVVRKEGNQNVLYVANIGDTRAVLSKSGTAERMSIDDKCDNQDEVKRVKSSGGIILDNRLGGVLAVTRAFGDHALTRVGLVATPHIVKYNLKPFDKYLVIASDGIWDELSDQDAADLCHEDLNTKRICQSIVKTALTRGSKDNISCIVLKFNGAQGSNHF